MDFDFLNIEYKCIVKNKQWVGNWVYMRNADTNNNCRFEYFEKKNRYSYLQLHN